MDENTTPETESDGWQERAADLHEKGGVPKKRAKVVALLEAGKSHSEIKETLDLNYRGEVHNTVEPYRDRDKPQAEWLAEHGPEV